MLFNYLFYFLLLALILGFRALPANWVRSRLAAVLLFNVICLIFFFTDSALLLLAIGLASTVALVIGRNNRLGPWVAALQILAGVAIFIVVKSHPEFTTMPTGLSFTLFLVVGYAIDCLRRLRSSGESAVSYFAGLTFSPFLTAGPYISMRRFLDGLVNPEPPSLESDREAGLLIAWGLLKKSIADMIFTFGGVHLLFSREQTVISSFICIPAYLYADFSGYSDVARGIALALGIRVPPNFLSPYLARNFTDFWRRWHISLGEWFREYAFNTLVFSVAPRLGLSSVAMRHFTRFAIVLTMVLVGLWHGLNWKFFLWGLAVGAMLVAPFKMPWPALNYVAMLIVVWLLQIVFFAPDLESLERLPSVVHMPKAFSQYYLAVMALVVAYALNRIDQWLSDNIEHLRQRHWLIWLFGIVLFTGLLLHSPEVEFVYSQF